MARLTSLVRPWRLAAAVLMGLTLFLGRSQPTQALIVNAVTLNASGAGATSDLVIQIALDSDIDATLGAKTITVTFPSNSQAPLTGVGWTLPAGAAVDLAAVGVSWGASLLDPGATIVGNSGARTITTTFNGVIQTSLAPLTLTIPASAGLTNPATPGRTASRWPRTATPPARSTS